MENKIKPKRLVYMNGEFVTEQNAKISIFDSALMFGDMVFEMTRSFNQKQFKLREHLERLYMGIKILHNKSGKGTLKINYSNLDQFDMLLKKLKN